MDFSRKDVKVTKKMEKKFVRYPEGAEKYSLGLTEFQALAKEAKARKDLRGRSLRKGEIQRSSDKRYMYTYTEPMGRRKFIYANDLSELGRKKIN